MTTSDLTPSALRATGIDRRTLLRRSAVLAAGTALAAGPFEALAARGALAASKRGAQIAGYGPLAPVRDGATGLPLLSLPKGFRYVSGSWTGDPMSGGSGTVPGAHDGMAALATGASTVALVRNHERGAGAPFGGPSYDPGASGGTTTLGFDTAAGRFLDTVPSLSGTIRNCAGGPTPEGTWLTCEETTTTIAGVPHGYVFEVPAAGAGNPVPFKQMGRFSHEAVAVDPRTGVVYETEDAGATSGLYRFLPNVRGDLAQGGTLQMLAIGDGNVTTNADGTGTKYDKISWVTIDVPDPDLANGGQRVYDQGRARGGAQFARLEGAWYDKRTVFFISTSGGPVGQGQVFAYDLDSEQLSVVYASPSAEVLNAPDNMCVSPRGGLVLCEDGSGLEYVHGLTQKGEIFKFALNNVNLSAADTAAAGKSVAPGDYTGAEWAGATFSPDGTWLFANIQSPGITFAITGPWGRGLL